MNINEEKNILVNVDNNWIIESKKLLKNNRHRNVISELASSQIEKLTSLDIPKMLLTVEYLFKDLKKINPTNSKIFFSQFFNHINNRKIDLSLLSVDLKIQMASYEIAKSIYESDFDSISKHIKHFGILDQKFLIEIVTNIGETSDYAMTQNIKKFGISDKHVLKEIAKYLANQDYPYFLAKEIKNFEITDQDVLIEIAKLIAQKVPSELSPYIQNFEITDQEAIKQIALTIAKKSPSQLPEYIQNFGISNQDVRFEISKLIVQNNPQIVAKNIQKFGFKNQDYLVQIAKSIAQSQYDYYSIAKYIQKFEILDQNVLIELAQLIAQKSYSLIANSIQNFGIDNQDVLIEIAKSIVQKEPSIIVDSIQNFKITKQIDLLEIAQAVAPQHSSALATYIQNFGIKDQDILIEIARLIARINPFALSKHIQNFGIKNQEAIIGIAQSIAQNDPSIIASCVQNFKIKDQNVFIRFAILIAQKNSNDLIRYIKSMNIDYTQVGGQEALVKMIKDVCIQEFPTHKSSIEWLEKRLKTPPWDNPLRQLYLWQWIMKILSLGRTAEHRQLFIEQQALLCQISKLDPQLRYSLTKIYIQMSNKDIASNQRQMLEKFQGLKEPDIKKISKNKNSADKISHLQLAILLFTTFPPYGKADYQKAIQALIPLREELRDGKNQKLLIETLLKIKNSALEDEKKLRLIHLLFESKEWQPANFRLVMDLLAFKAEPHLHTFANFEQLKQILENVFKERFDIKIDDFSDKYQKTIGMWRNKEALTTYASTLNELEREENQQAHQYLTEVVKNVLEGNFQNNRYKTDHNPHLKEIKDFNPNLFKKWQEACQLDVSELQSYKNEDLIKDLRTSLETLQKIVKEMPMEGLDIYQVDLFKLEEELNVLKPELERANIESESITKKIEQVIVELRALKNLKENNLIIAKKTELETLKKELDANKKLQKKAVLLKALSHPQAENLIPLQNLLNIDKDIYKKMDAPKIFEALQKFTKIIDKSLMTPKGILSKEDFEEVLKPIKEGLGGLISNDPIRYLLLQACLKDKEKIKTSIKQIEAELKALNPKGQTKKEKNRLEFERLYYLKEKALLQVLKKPGVKQLESLRSLFTKEKEPFYQPIENALTLSKKYSKTHEKLVMDTDDPNHFLLMGTEVRNSCQDVGGKSRENKCLLGFFLDGKHRLALVCEPNGKILARAVLRLLIDKEGQPVLFQEKIYVADLKVSLEYKKLIRKIAKKKAQILGIPLLVCKKDYLTDEGPNYSSDVHAKDKPVPFEYVDALENPILKPYTLKKENIIQVS